VISQTYFHPFSIIICNKNDSICTQILQEQKSNSDKRFQRICFKKYGKNEKSEFSFKNQYYLMGLPNGTSSFTVSQKGLSSTSAASNMAFDSTPAIFFGSRFAMTITVFPTISSG